jgi:phage terminase small subunit
VSLGPKQNRFVAEYLKDLNGTQAAIRAGYSAHTADQQASRLLANVKVKQAVAEAMSRRGERVEVKQDDVLRVLLRNLKFDPAKAHDERGNLLSLGEMPEEARLAIQSIEWGQYGPKVKFWSKDKALELAMRHLGLLTDKMEHSVDSKTLEQLVMASLNKGAE